MQKRRLSLGLISWVLAIGLWVYPINTLPIRVGLLTFTFLAYANLIWLSRRIKPVFWGLIAIAAMTGGFLILPGRDGEPGKMRTAYLNCLRSYEGTHYIWGGENKFGIDCSGLVRAGMIKANFQLGCLTLNPQLTRFALSLWWHDCSAKALGEEYRGQTIRIISARGINSLDATQILPGDMAVTASGVHVLAYLGGDEWIEADPEAKKVIIVNVPANNPWFQEPVNIMRWTELESK